MRRYLISRICRVTVLWATISLIPTYSFATSQPENRIASKKYIIQVSDRNRIQSFAGKNNIEISPLISYPDPSEDVKDIFRDYYLVEISNESGITKNEALNLLSNQSWVKSVQYDETTPLPKDLGGPQSVRSFNDPNPLPTPPHDPLYPYQWDKIITCTEQAWSKTTGSSEVKIAILDSGVDSSHEDLSPNIIYGYNFIENNNDFEDDNGHGTKIAGVIAAKINNDLGIAGVAGNSKIMALKVVNSFGNVTRSDAINAILYAVDNGADVITMSFGFNGPNEAEGEAIEYAWGKGVFLTASAGNKGEYEPNHYPSSYEHVMAVGASDSDDERVDFSNYGDNVDVYAPGKSVWMTLMDGGYGTGSGTSYAAPQIAGLAALIQSAYSDYSAQEVWSAIIYSADTINTDVGLVVRMNSQKALDYDFSTTADVSDPIHEYYETYDDIIVSVIQGNHLQFTIDKLESSNYRIKIYDLTGKVVYDKQGNIDTEVIVLNDLNLVSGVYFWQLQTDSCINPGKIVLLK